MIIGITGTLGAGKGTVVEFLVNEKGFTHYSVRQFLIKEIEKRGLEINRDSMLKVANELRANNGASYITDELYKEAVAHQGDAVIESIRAVGEITSLRQKGEFILLAIDADPVLRYERILERGSETDNISFETFLENEKREMINTDPNKQNIAACMALADVTIRNDYTKGYFEEQIKKVIDGKK
ncbi:MAG: AAA family ATPase [Bacteroidales bacterium]|jgi:dephospho-CoA kinase|nr:AAA family ATPase [Bacteroidales bacterium]